MVNKYEWLETEKQNDLNKLETEKQNNLNKLEKKKCFKKKHNYPFKSIRRIALKICYDGKNYRGVQYHKFIRSIEGELIKSLEQSGIGENPVFCGRTDAEVSAIGMIVSIDVKSRHIEPNRGYELSKCDKDEYPYDKIINENLPDDIRVCGWAPVPDTFNARHSCIQRYYKYYFINKNMNISLVKEACEKIKMMTNFYKLSTHSNPRAVYERKLDEIYIEKVEDEGDSGYNTMYCLNIKAGSFLHNMVRKIAWLIQSCGNGNPFSLEQVRIAPAYPLIFVNAKYKNKLNFIGNRFSKSKFEKDWDKTRIENQIAKFKFYNHDN